MVSGHGLKRQSSPGSRHDSLIISHTLPCSPLTPANVDERLVVRNWFGLITGLLIGDKGFISKDLDEECGDLAIDNGLYC